MIQNRFTGEADAAGQRYVGMIAAWRGIYERAIAGDIGSPRSLRALSEQAYEIARVYLDAERKLLAAAFDGIALQARIDVLNDAVAVDDAQNSEGRVSELLSASESYALNEIVVQIERDVAFIVRQARNAALSIELTARSLGVSRQAAQIQYRARGAGDLRFYFNDRVGRKWPSQKFVRAVVRGSLLDLYNQTVMATLIEAGVDTAKVRHADPASKWHDFEITLVPARDMPIYEEIREEAFHANSDAVLAHPGDI